MNHESQKYIVALREEIQLIPALLKGINVQQIEMNDRVFFTSDKPQVLRKLQQHFDAVAIDYTETWL